MLNLFFQADRSLHFISSIVIIGGVFMMLYYMTKISFMQSLVLAVYFFNILGILYEVYQVWAGLYETISYKDLLFNLLGTLVIFILIFLSHPAQWGEVH